MQLCDKKITRAYHRRWYIANSEMERKVSTTSVNKQKQPTRMANSQSVCEANNDLLSWCH